MAKKKILVKDILDLMEGTEEIMIQFSAYGVGYANSTRDGMETVADCKALLRYDCLNAKVLSVRSFNGVLVVSAEIVH